MNTKKIPVLVLALLVGTLAFAQKGSVSKAESYKGKGDFINAKAEIDMAITIEKNAAKSRTWYVRGQIYEEIAKSPDMSVSSIDKDALTKAMESYGKVLEMEKPNSSYHSLTTLNIDALWGNYLNEGGTAYGEQDYAMALSNFEKALVTKPGDSTTLLYAGASAQQLEDTDKINQYYGQMYKQGDASEDVFSTLIYVNRIAGNNEEALAITRAAKEQYPKNKTYTSEELSILITLNKLDEAKKKLLVATQTDPEVAINHLNLAVLYDNLGTKLTEEGNAKEGREKLDSAQISYSRVLEIDPDSYVSNYNIGAIYVNNAKEYLDQARDMDLKTYQKKGPALEEKAKEVLKKAMPYFVKVTTIKADDIDAWSTLQSIYSTLKMYDKAEEVMNKVEELEATQGTE